MQREVNPRLDVQALGALLKFAQRNVGVSAGMGAEVVIGRGGRLDQAVVFLVPRPGDFISAERVAAQQVAHPVGIQNFRQAFIEQTQLDRPLRK